MRWVRGRRSQNVEDRRGASGSSGGRVPIGFRIPGGMAGRGVRRGGLGGIGLIAFVLIALFLGVDPSALLEGGSSTSVPGQAMRQEDLSSPEQEELKDFVSVVLADTEDTWHELFGDMGQQYQEPTLVLFSGAVESACGFAQSAVGPFYCPRDQKVYIDLGFYDDLRRRFRAPGDFAQAYVIAHEIGHHVQTLLGISQEVQAVRQQVGEADGNALSVMLELQADCLAGVWAHHADRSRDLLDEGDIEEGLNAASAIGDDRMQRRSQGYVVPESFTHGSSEQRMRWFRRGFHAGQLAECDTFNAARL